MSEEYSKSLLQIVKGAGINFFGAICRQGLGFLYVLVLARVLNTTDLGLYYLGVTIFSIVSIMCLCGTDTGLKRFVSIYHGLGDVKRMTQTFVSALLTVLPLSIIIGSFLFYFAPTISKMLFSKPRLADVLRNFSWCLPFFTTALICLAATQGMKYMQYKVLSQDIMQNTSKIIFILAFHFMGLRLLGAIFAYVFSVVLLCVMSVYFLLKVFPISIRTISTGPELKQLLRFSTPQTFSSLIYQLTTMTDTLMLGYFLLSSDVGIYSVALKVAMIGSCILISFNTMFSPVISDLDHRRKYGSLESLYKTITKWVTAMSVPVYLFLIFFSREILGLFGKEFLSGSLCLVVLAIGQIVNAATGPSGLMVLMSGHQFINLFNNLLILLLNFTLNAFLIPRFGILGAAIATTFSIALMNVLRLIEVYYLFKIQPYGLSFLKVLLAGAISLMCASLISKYLIITSGILNLAGIFGGFAAIYALAMLLFGLDDADRLVLDTVKTYLGK